MSGALSARYNSGVDRDLERQWVRQWAETGRLLDEMRRRELRSLSDARRLQIIDDLLSIPVVTPTPERRRGTSGLVAQQAFFQKNRLP